MNKPMSSLVKTAVGVALTGSTSLLGIRWIMQSRIRHSDMYKEAIAYMRNNPNVKDILGTPIKAKGVDVSRWKHYGYEKGKMWVSVPVKGPKRSGYLHYVVTVEDHAKRKLRLTKVEFEVDGLEANNRVTLMKISDEKSSLPSSQN